jgi:hypothetical protein
MIRPGLLPLGHGQLYDRLFDQRQRSDYTDLVHFGVAEVRAWYGEAQAFVDAVAMLIQQALAPPSLDRTALTLAPPRREAIALNLWSYQCYQFSGSTVKFYPSTNSDKLSARLLLCSPP